MRTLDGLARQTYPKDSFEVIVVSDGSQDGTLEMLSERRLSFPCPLITIPQFNSGPSAARNRGFAEAHGEVVVFIDDDVEPVPEWLERHARHHEKDECVVVLGPMNPDPKCARFEPVWIAWEHDRLQATYDYFRAGGEYANADAAARHFYSGNASLRIKWLRQVGGFNLKFSRQEDVEMATRLEREADVKFRFDMDAIGIHRPQRTFAAWESIPCSYAEMDAKRIIDGSLNWDYVVAEENKRNNLTKKIFQLRDKGVVSFVVFGWMLKITAMLLSFIGLKSLAISVLSALYNSSYSIIIRSAHARFIQGSA